MVGDSFAPIPFVGEVPEDDIDLFGEYRALSPILVCGTRCEVPEGNNVLRALQYLEIKTGCVRLEWARYCWNDTEGCCEMTYRAPGGAGATNGRACRVLAEPGLEIVVLPKGGRLT